MSLRRRSAESHEEEVVNGSRIVVAEFNELTPHLVDAFVRAGELPNFARMFRESEIWTTCSDEPAPNLEPWIQWVTLHCGVPFSKHGIFRLGDGANNAFPSLWDLVSEAGGEAWVCGSMNAARGPAFKGWFLPDPWTHAQGAAPGELDALYRFISSRVVEHTNPNVKHSRADALRFLSFMARHGLTASTVMSVVRQLLGEVRDRSTRWRRAMILDRLMLDVFLWRYRRSRSALSTYFSNSTAHFQHIYWRYFDPEPFSVKPTAEESRRYGDAVLSGYRNMDWMLGRMLDSIDDKTTLVLATALSQQPCLKYEDQGGKRSYRPRDFARFFDALGVEGVKRIEPVMTHQFHCEFSDERAAQAGMEKLLSLEYPGAGAVLTVFREGAKLFGGCRVSIAVPAGTTVDSALLQRSWRFDELFYLVDTVKSGMHDLDGMLWIRRPDRRHAVHPGTVPLVDVAPTLLEILGLPAPPAMEGRSLSSRAREALSA
jgi:hypothetical protein